MKSIFTLLILVLITNDLFGAFSVTRIDANDFPNIKVNFSATTPAGFPYDNLSVDDFIVTENGKDVSESLVMTCREDEEDAELSILLVLDMSGSMETNPDDGVRRWDWVVEGATKFIETIEFKGRTKIAVTTFSGIKSVNLIADFTQDRGTLITAIEEVVPNGATFYNPPLIDDEEHSAMELLTSQPPDMNRICVFLTDGLAEPNEVKKTDEIINQFSGANIQMYGIVMLMPVPSDISKICQETGGKSFQVEKREELTEIYELIAIEAQSRQICELTWIADYGCDEFSRERDVVIDFTRDLDPLPKLRDYIAPEKSIAKLVPKESDLLTFGNPEIDIKVTNSATFIVENGPFTYKGHKFTPPTFFGFEEININGNPATIGDEAQPGDEIEIVLSFTQKDEKDLRQALFELEGSFCPGYLNVVGGFSKVLLVTPQAGTFANCDGVDITWAGVEETTPVNIYYTTDYGASWNLIERNVVGGNYKWYPDFATDNLKIKVEREARQYYRWVQHGKNNMDAELSGIAIDNQENYLYISGYHQETLNFMGYKNISSGNHDLFLTKIDKDGFPQWMIKAGTNYNDSLAGVVVSNAGNIFAAGVVHQGIQIGTNFPGMNFDGVPYGMVMKVTPAGEVVRVQTIGPRDNDDNRVWVRGIKYEPGNDRIVVVGRFFKRATFTPTTSLNSNNIGNFIAYYDSDLNFITASATNYNIDDYKVYSISDSDDNEYGIHTFEGEKSFDEFNIESQDGLDVAVSKYGKVQATEDQSRENIVIEKPILEFTSNQVDLGDATVGTIGGKDISNLLKNPGELPIKIENFFIDEDEVGEFTLKADLIGQEIGSNEEKNLEFSFAPKQLGLRSATLTIIGECADEIKVELIGNGTCKGESDELVQVGKKTIDVESRIVVEDIFYNPTSQTIKITPTITDDPQNEFRILGLDGSSNETTSLNVPAFSFADFVIYFTPKGDGIRTAKIDYGVDVLCENTFSDLEGVGISSSIVGTTEPITNRIRTVNRGEIVLENLSELDAEISELTIIEDTEGYFELVDLQNSYTIEGEQSIIIEYNFTPLVEGEYNAKLQFKLASGQIDASTELVGTGLFPELTLEFDCPENEAVQTQTSQSTLRITNNSNLTDVDVLNIQSLVGDYVINGSTSLIIPANDSREVLVNFTPSSVGAVDYDFVVTADVAIGNMVDDTYAADSTLPNLTGSCNARPNTNNFPINFENVLICGEPGIFTHRIENPSNSVEMVINKNDIVMTPDDGVFELDMPQEITIQPGGTYELKIIFTPTAPVNYSADVQLVNNLGIDYLLKLSGTGVYISLNASKGLEEFTPGPEVTDVMTFSANIAKLSTGDINGVTINLKFNNRVIHFEEDKIVDLTGGILNWTVEYITIDEINLVGTGSLPTEFNGNLISIEYYLQLSNDFKDSVDYSINIGDCKASVQELLEVRLSEFCMRNFRIFNSSGFSDDLATVAPNPVNTNTNVPYSVAFDGNLKIEIVDVLGNTILIPVDEYKEAGFYEFMLEADKIPNGMYFIKYQSVMNTKTQKFIINK